MSFRNTLRGLCHLPLTWRANPENILPLHPALFTLPTGNMERGEGSDDTQDMLLRVADVKFLLSLPNSTVSDAEKVALREELMATVRSQAMAPFVADHSASLLTDAEISAMMKANAEKVAKMEAVAEDAVANLGETEVRDASVAKACFLASTGDKTALGALEDALDKTVGVGQKIDLVLQLVRFSMFLGDEQVSTLWMDRARKLTDEGGDWERRNRFKVYEATHMLSRRDFAGAASLLVDSVATFTCVELFSFEHLVLYVVLASIVSLPRTALRDKVINSPDVRQVIGSTPHLTEMLNCLYSCDYRGFNTALVGVMLGSFRRDRILAQHESYFMREIRVVAYKQFLQSYLSVTLQSMAHAFGVSVNFLDSYDPYVILLSLLYFRDLSAFICAGRLSCKIDKVAGVIEMNRPDCKNAQYQEVIRQGDLLLNRIQKLARVIV